DLIEWDLHDKWFDTVIKFDGDGNFLWSRRTHSNPIGVEVDEDCNIYIYGDTEDQDIIGGFSMFDFGETNIISHANMFTFYTRLGHEYKEDGFYKFFVEESVYNIPEGRVFGRSFTPAEGENYITLEGNGIAEIEVPWDCTADQMAQI